MSVKPVRKSVGKPFPSSIDKSRGTAKAEPNFIGRNDLAHGRWTVEECQAVRGEPMTDLNSRTMFTPSQTDELARSIRGHELMHSKVSPNGEQFEMWVAREMASAHALTVVEELRINILCQEAGFDVKKHLADGGELSDGERLAQTGDWAGAVTGAIATAGTAGHKQFLNGIRRHNRAWGDALLDISKRAVREMKKAHKTRSLASTAEHHDLAPYGFVHTERIAEWVDRLASFPPPKEREQEKKGKAGASGTGIDKSGEGEKDPATAVHSNEGDSDEGDKKGIPHQSITPTSHSGTGKWTELRIERVPMPRLHAGTIGKRRVATNMGRRPRRMHRYMTDPAKRVFDKTVRGSGGMVIIDASGSMSFTKEQIWQITDLAKGATVAIYSDRHKKNGANMWIIADKGRMIETLENIPYGHGNGVDYPAIVWGVENRQYRNTPLVWITDGGVCGEGDGYTDLLAMQCLTYAMKHNYIVVPHIEEAIEQLSNMNKGVKPKSVYPPMFREVYRKHMGVNIQQ